MSDYLSINGIKFDFITTSKFVGEFYNVAMPKELKLYCNLTESVSPFLQPDGIYLLLDVVAGSRDRSCDFKTIILGNELNTYVKSPYSTLSYIYPYPCACWSSVCQTVRCYIEKCFSVSHSRNQCDESKVAYRIMAHKEFASKIVGQREVRERYPIKTLNMRPWEEIQITTDSGEVKTAIAPLIISASRSTDIPAFHSEWLINRLKRGYVSWVNPFNPTNAQTISFRNVRLFVFWTKNPKPLIPHLTVFDKLGLNYYFQ